MTTSRKAARRCVIAKLPLDPLLIINLTRLTAGMCMKLRFKSKVARGFSLLATLRLVFHRFAALSQLKKNLWYLGVGLIIKILLCLLGKSIFLISGYCLCQG